MKKKEKSKKVRRKPRPWHGPMGGVECDREDGCQKTAHIRLPHAILTAHECRRMAAWMSKAAEWIENDNPEN